MTASAWSRFADAFGDAAWNLLRVGFWLTLAGGLLIVAPLVAISRLHRADPARTEGVLRQAAHLFWTPLQNGAAVFGRGRARLARSCRAAVEIASYGRDPLWMAVVCTTATAALAVATYFGWRTEQATLKVALNPGAAGIDTAGGVSAALAPVRDWMTFAVFVSGALGGALVLEAIGVTHFIRRRPTSEDEVPISTGDETAVLRDQHGGDPLSRPKRIGPTVRSIAQRVLTARAALLLVGVVFLAVPVYGLSTAATSRAANTVLPKREWLAARGWQCNPETAALRSDRPNPGFTALSENRANSECTRLVGKHYQIVRWGLVTAAAMALLDIFLGWLAVLSLVWIGAAVLAIGQAGLALGAGAGRAVANLIDLVLRLVLVAIRRSSGTVPQPSIDEPGAASIRIPTSDTPVEAPDTAGTIDLRDAPTNGTQPPATAHAWTAPPPETNAAFDPWA